MKSDKELTAEIVIAYINANPTQASYAGGTSPSKVDKYITVEGVCKCISSVYATLSQLYDNNHNE